MARAALSAPATASLATGSRCAATLFEVLAFPEHLLVLGLAGDHTRQRKNSDGDHNQQANDHTEGIEEMGVLLAHVWIRVERL